jgi:hypothetical protein
MVFAAVTNEENFSSILSQKLIATRRLENIMNLTRTMELHKSKETKQKIPK